MSDITVLVIAAAVAAWMAGRRYEKVRRARADMADALDKAAQLKAAIPTLIIQAVLALAVLSVLLSAAAAAGR